MFSETALGNRASEFEEGLLAWPVGERAAHVSAAALQLREAAQRERVNGGDDQVIGTSAQ